jgi:hypothetical protein
MTISQELNSIYDEQMRVVGIVANDMLSELIHVTPVALVNGGSLKGAWDIQTITNGYRLSNNLEYADVIFDGRRLVAGKWYGSEQLPAGLDPILAKYNLILERELDGVRT